MAKFVLKNPSGKDKTLIYLVYYFQGKKFKYSTGEKIHPDFWNASRQRPRKDYTNYTSLNRSLDRIDALISDIHTRLNNEGRPASISIFREEMKKELLKKGRASRETFIEFIERFILECNKKPDTITKFKTTLSHLKDYQKAKDFPDIDVKWFDTYTAWMEEEKNFSLNYIGKQLRVIKQLLNEATEQRINHNLEYRSRRITIPEEDAESIYLTVDDLLSLYNANLPPGQRRVCDLFMIGAFTGLRFSDLARLTSDNIDGDVIRITQVKTGDAVVIPVHWIVREILDGYRGQVPPAISNQKMNVALKLIGARAGLNDMVVKTRTKGGKRTSQAFQKWELLTTHTARRSAATNMYLAGVPAISIMKITGHRTEKAFMKYIKISQEENARLMLENPFFRKG